MVVEKSWRIWIYGIWIYCVSTYLILCLHIICHMASKPIQASSTGVAYPLHVEDTMLLLKYRMVIRVYMQWTSLDRCPISFQTQSYKLLDIFWPMRELSHAAQVSYPIDLTVNCWCTVSNSNLSTCTQAEYLVTLVPLSQSEITSWTHLCRENAQILQNKFSNTMSSVKMIVVPLKCI